MITPELQQPHSRFYRFPSTARGEAVDEDNPTLETSTIHHWEILTSESTSAQNKRVHHDKSSVEPGAEPLIRQHRPS
ncbi:hypothetical protein TNCV_1677571 [Trichonephila clavipes]|nr:hypothetical protein TNCV_1677571 [Trichonephila clavipes]